MSLDTINYRGYTINIEQEEYPDSPRIMISLESFLTYIREYKIPPSPPEGSSSMGSIGVNYKETDNAREECTDRGMWAIVDKVWTKQLADWIGGRGVLEIMAGAGWLAKALSDYGVNIIATDSGGWDKRHSKMKLLFPIEKLEGGQAIKKYQNAEILLVSWPPYGDHTICKICKEWGGLRPIIYIGEGYIGCNAPSEFFDNFASEKSINFSLMSWPTIHNCVSIGYYKNKNKGV